MSHALGQSWTHLLARRAVRPLVGTGVTPNHLTTIRMLTGAAACVAFAIGGPAGDLWGGVLWLVSCFMDRADGELARIGDMTSPGGHLYDYYVDNTVTAAFFAAIGIGLRHSWLGGAAIPLGLFTAVALALCGWTSELLERQRGPGFRAYSGWMGFDPDDGLYLLAPFAWLGWLPVILVLSAVGTATMLAITLVRLRRPETRRSA